MKNQNEDSVYCPNCNQKMKHSYKAWETYAYDFGPEPDYPALFIQDKYSCKKCHIRKINGEWEIPDKYAPTYRQRMTLLFINRRLHLDLKPLTKHQCWRDIGRYFEKAKRIAYY